ncbi:MAG: phosphoribosyl-AMP cyclohydrolase, partial [Euryarchaeota archaeon]
MITIQDVEDAQEKWGQGIVEISSAYSQNGEYVKRAELHINTLYDYKEGDVLFKPTFASDVQFRSTFDSALSYFVGENGVCPEDHGFAIKGWAKVRFQND